MGLLPCFFFIAIFVLTEFSWHVPLLKYLGIPWYYHRIQSITVPWYHYSTFSPSASLYCTYSSTRSFPCATFSSARSPFPVTLNCRQSSGAYGAETEAVTSCSTLSLTHPPRGEQLFHRHRRRRTDWLELERIAVSIAFARDSVALHS